MSRVRLAIIILLLTILAPSAQLSQATDDISSLGLQALHLANDNYNKGLYKEAAQGYEQAAAEINNGHIFYNLANCYYRLGNIGRAIYNYRRALKLLPTNPDIKTNLQLARKQTKDHLFDYHALPGPGVLALANYFPPTTMYWSFISAYLIFWLLLVLQHKKQNFLWKLVTFSSAIIMLWVGISYFVAVQSFDGTYTLGISKQSRDTVSAVVLSSKVSIYSGDSEHYQVVFILHEGAEILVTEKRGNWFKILLPDGKQGWAQKTELELVL
ncbi:MAG: tetratricopeptide repeat protein [Deltaproteobacteria bacterium]|nr:tetratricopeptide repeat protein [Deltaproteobacteria bacterium]